MSTELIAGHRVLLEGCECLNENCELDFPPFTGRRIMMMPFLIEKLESTIPDELFHLVADLIDEAIETNRAPKKGVAYLTYDEKHFLKEETHRRSGLHVDGVYRERGTESVRPFGGGWGGGGSWGGGSIVTVQGDHRIGNGFLLASNIVGCRAHGIARDDEVGDEGGLLSTSGADGMLQRMMRFPNPVELPAKRTVWMHPMMVHESLEQKRGTKRALIRISLPSNCPWFEGYTESPFGVKPTGPILPRRPFMDD